MRESQRDRRLRSFAARVGQDSGRSAPCVQPNTPDEHQRENVRSARDVSPRSVQFSVAKSVQFTVAIDNRHRDVDRLVGIDPDNYLPNLGLRGHGVSHRLASSGAARGLARVGGQDCDGPWVRQAPLGSRLIRSAGCRTIGRWAVTDRSMTRTVGQSGCGSGHRPPAPTGVTERPRQAGGSCSQSG